MKIKAGSSAADCVNQFLSVWRSRGLNSADSNIIGHFLFGHGAYKELLYFVLDCIEKDDSIPWYYLGCCLQKLDPEMRGEVFQSLKLYISEQHKLDEFTTSPLFDLFFPGDGDLKLAQLQARAQIRDRHRQTLLDQIKVFNQSRNYPIEKQAIDKFLRFFPHDQTGAELLRRFENEELQRFFKRYSHEKKVAQEPQIETFTLKEKDLLESLFLQVYKIVKTQGPPKGVFEASDINGFVYFFLFLEDYSHALALVPHMEASPSRDWLHVELLILTKKFADALAYLKQLDTIWAAEPSYYSAKVYYVAQCFWGLGDRHKAIELMENLNQIKPDYRLSGALLKEWRSDL
jgi:hypothetical protein